MSNLLLYIASSVLHTNSYPPLSFTAYLNFCDDARTSHSLIITAHFTPKRGGISMSSAYKRKVLLEWS
jgi:hypothetical protein